MATQNRHLTPKKTTLDEAIATDIAINIIAIQYLKFFLKKLSKNVATCLTLTDGARWIDACIKKYIPHATRCVDGFHVVTWAMEALDSVRKDIWRDAQNSYKEAKNTTSSVKVNLIM